MGTTNLTKPEFLRLRLAGPSWILKPKPVGPGEKKECRNYWTIALMPHASKILLHILQKRLEYYLIPNLLREQAGFRKGRGMRHHIANLRWMMEEAREFDKVLVLCFIDYKHLTV